MQAREWIAVVWADADLRHHVDFGVPARDDGQLFGVDGPICFRSRARGRCLIYASQDLINQTKLDETAVI